MTPSIPVPTRPEDVTRDWVADVLQRSGVLGDDEVSSIRLESIGDAGLIGELTRVEIEYAGRGAASDVGPASLIVKRSNRDARQRAIFHGIGLYGRELDFYRDFADRSPLRTPRCHHAALDPDTGHSVLVLEDLSAHRTVDVAAGCSFAEAAALVRALARHHAHWWNHPELVAPSAHAPVDRVLRIWHAIHQNGWPAFAVALGRVLPDVELPSDLLALGDRLARSSGDVFVPLARAPVTLVHMDLHLDNLVFDEPQGAAEPVIFDWQTWGVGRGAMDLGYFVVSALPTALREEREAELLELYAAGLRDHGVGEVDPDACRADYALAALWNLMVVTGMVADAGDDPERRKYLAAVVPRLASFVRDHDVVERLAP